VSCTSHRTYLHLPWVSCTSLSCTSLGLAEKELLDLLQESKHVPRAFPKSRVSSCGRHDYWEMRNPLWTTTMIVRLTRHSMKE